MTRKRTEATAPSRRGRFPSPAISWAIGVTELRRFGRRIRSQDVWLLMMAIGVVAILLMVPVIFGLARDYGTELGATGEVAGSAFPLIFIVGWPVMLLFGLVSGVTGEGEIDGQEGILTVRPPKDVAGGLLLYVWLGYAPFVLIPGVVAAVGLGVGMGEPAVGAGVLVALTCVLVTGTLVGYVIGLLLKGAIRRSPWLSRLKPLLGAIVVVGYFWLIFTDRLWPIMRQAGERLEGTPLAWYADLAFVTSVGVETSTAAAAAVLGLSLLIVPPGLLAVVRAGEYAWYVDVEEGGASPRTDDRSGPSPGEWLDRLLANVGLHPATRGITVAALLRGYRAPLQLVYVAVPFLFMIPIVDPIIRTGEVPSWFPWMVIMYGGWAAGASFPLNILGNQGSTLPRLLTSPAQGRRVMNGYILATAIAFVPLTVAIGVITANAAGRSAAVILSVAVGSVAVVVAGAILAAGIGVTFPRFSTIDLTDSTSAVLPSKLAFALLSAYGILAANSVGLLVDDVYRAMIAAIVSEVLPYGMSVTEAQLEVGAAFIAFVGLVALPLAYVGGAKRFDAYRVS